MLTGQNISGVLFFLDRMGLVNLGDSLLGENKVRIFPERVIAGSCPLTSFTVDGEVFRFNTQEQRSNT